MRITVILKWANGAKGEESFIHFYCKMLSVKLQKERYETIISGKLLEAKDKGMNEGLMMNRWKFFLFFPPTFAGIFIFLMTSINQHECLALESKNKRTSLLLRFVCSTFRCPEVTLSLPPRVQIYIFPPSANINVFFHYFHLPLFFSFVKYCYGC